MQYVTVSFPIPTHPPIHQKREEETIKNSTNKMKITSLLYFGDENVSKGMEHL